MNLEDLLGDMKDVIDSAYLKVVTNEINTKQDEHNLLDYLYQKSSAWIKELDRLRGCPI